MELTGILALLEREEDDLNLDDGTNMRMGPVRNGRLGSLSDAEWARRERERKRKLSDGAGVGNVKLSLLDLWRKAAA